MILIMFEHLYDSANIAPLKTSLRLISQERDDSEILYFFRVSVCGLSLRPFLPRRDRNGGRGQTFQPHGRDLIKSKDLLRVENLNTDKLFSFADIQRHFLI